MSSARRDASEPSTSDSEPRTASGLRPRVVAPEATGSGSFVSALPIFTPEECAAMTTAILEQNAYALRTRLASRALYTGRARDAAELEVVQVELVKRLPPHGRRNSSFPPPPKGDAG